MEIKNIHRRIKMQILILIASILLVVVLIFAMTAAWFTNVAKTSNLTFQTESWGFDADKITVGDETIENYSISIAPGTSGVIPLTVDNRGADAETVLIGVTISKTALDETGNAQMDAELQKRIFFYADTDRTATFQQGTANENSETVSKVYLGTSAPDNYTYTILPGQMLTMNELYSNDVPLKWEWIYDMLGYYFRGTVAKGGAEDSKITASVDEYLRPIEYDYDFDQPIFDDEDQLVSVQGKTTAEFLAELSGKDGYEGTIDMDDMVEVEVEVEILDEETDETKTETRTQLYYPVAVDEGGYGVWAYLCTKEEILAGIAYDTGLSESKDPVTAKATIVLTANSVPAKIESVSTEKDLLDALQGTGGGIVELQSDVSLSEAFTYTEGTKILDLNGYTLSYSGTATEYNMVTVENGAKLTVTNGDIVGTSASTTTASIKTKAFDAKAGNLVLTGVDISGFDTAVFVEDMSAAEAGDSLIQITDCTLEAKQGALVLQGNGAATDSTTKVYVQGSTLTSAYNVAITGQGNDDRWGTELVIADSAVTGYYGGIYQPQRQSVTTIIGSTISGNTGIALKGGTINIYDNSKIIGTGAVAVYDAAISKSGFTDTGDAVYVEAAYDWSATVTLKGENIEAISEKAYAVELIGADDMGPGKVLIYDGKYSIGTAGKGSAKWNDIGTFEIYGGTFSSSVSDTITRYDLTAVEE